MNSGQYGGLQSGTIAGIIIVILIIALSVGGGLIYYYYYSDSAIKKQKEKEAADKKAKDEADKKAKDEADKKAKEEANKNISKENDMLSIKPETMTGSIDASEFKYRDTENSNKIFKIYNKSFYTKNSPNDVWTKVDYLQVYLSRQTNKCWKIFIADNKQFTTGPCNEPWTTAPQFTFDIMGPDDKKYTINLK